MLDLKQSCAVSIVRSVPLTILDGSTFCVCDERGDIAAPTAGLFAEDTRFLSRCLLTVNGERPLYLSSAQPEAYSGSFFMRNPLAGGLGRDELTIARRRHVAAGMQDTLVFFSLPVRIEGSRARFDVELDPRQEWSVRMDVLPAPDGDTTGQRAAERQLAQALGSTADAAAAWRLGLPKLEASLSDIDGTYRRSTSDLASLRLTDADSNGGGLIAAGTPWFMTIFGRD